MTKQELNRDIKRLWKKTKEADVLCEWTISEIKAEYKRLFYADPEFEHMNKDNLLRMMALNSKHRFIQLHQFPLGIKEELL